MINKLKNNTKIKFISLLSALVLWLYVMTVEDPLETRTFSDIPIAITNLSMIDDRGLAIYPKEELFTDISINGNLSSLRAINRNNIYIYGRIEDPKEGKNTIYLQANLPERVSKYDIKPHVVTVNLEKVVNEKRSIKLDIKGTPKINIDTIDTNKKTINVEGPRSLVNEVTSINATVDVSGKNQDFSTKLKLIPVNSDGDEVKGVTLEENYIIANVKLLQQKTVPVNLNLVSSDNTNDIAKSYTINPSEVTIEGKKEIIDGISSINTQPINIEDLKDTDSIEVALELPKGVKVSNETVDIKVEIDKNITTELLISKTAIEFRNKEDVELNLDKIPENIKVTIIHSSKEPQIKEEEIKLYVDLLDNSLGEGKFTIKYDTNINFKSIKIDPASIEI